jgi:hypothetical protein
MYVFWKEVRMLYSREPFRGSNFVACHDWLLHHIQPTYKTAVETSTTTKAATEQDDQIPAPQKDVSAWTYDWKADMDRGVALGQHYKAIGDAINAHYRETFDPTYPVAANGGRKLKSKEKKMKDQKKEELALAGHNNGDAALPGWYDWQADRERGMAIGMNYKQIGEEVSEGLDQSMRRFGICPFVLYQTHFQSFVTYAPTDC